MSTKRKHKIIELTWNQFLTYDLDDIGFNGQFWDPSIDAVVVNSVAVFDRFNAISFKGRAMMNKWLRKRFGYRL
jgi:hypothetical protein